MTGGVGAQLDGVSARGAERAEGASWTAGPNAGKGGARGQRAGIGLRGKEGSDRERGKEQAGLG